MDDIGSEYGRVCARCVQTNETNEHMCHQKCFLFRRRSWEWGRSAIWTDWHTSTSTSSSAFRDDRTNTVIMTRWVYTVHNSVATIFSYSKISSLCRIIFVFIIRSLCFFLGSCSHLFAVPPPCHCVNSINLTSRRNYCDINDEGNFRIYILKLSYSSD